MEDKQGRPYALVSKVKVGDILIVDDDFTCMDEWSEHEVLADGRAPPQLYVKCSSGAHYLNGQMASDQEDFASDADHDYYIGMYLKEDFVK